MKNRHSDIKSFLMYVGDENEWGRIDDNFMDVMYNREFETVHRIDVNGIELFKFLLEVDSSGSNFERLVTLFIRILQDYSFDNKLHYALNYKFYYKPELIINAQVSKDFFKLSHGIFL